MVNDLIPVALEANVAIHEAKAFTANLRRGACDRLPERLPGHSDSPSGGPATTPRGTRVTPEDTTSDTYLAETTHREAMTQELMQLGR